MMLPPIKKIPPTPKPPRKIIQIENCPESENTRGSILALCNDGTIWYFRDFVWRPLGADITQD